MLTLSLLLAATLIPIDQNRPMIDVTIENVMEAVASPDPDAMKRLMDRVRKSPNAKSKDFHSFNLRNDRIVAYLWPRECLPLMKLKGKSPSIFATPMHAEPYVFGPFARMQPGGSGLQCLMFLEIDHFEKTNGNFRIEPDMIVSETMLLNLVSGDAGLRKAAKAALIRQSGGISGRGHPIAWIYGNGDTLHLQFKRSNKCVTRDWLSKLGYTLSEEEGWMATMAYAKDNKRPTIQVGFDPQRPECLSALMTS